MRIQAAIDNSNGPGSEHGNFQMDTPRSAPVGPDFIGDERSWLIQFV